MAKEKIGQIGLGALGSHFARRLIENFAELLVLDIDARKVDRATQSGATAATSARDLAAGADIILLSLPNPAAVRSVLLNADSVLEGARPGTLVIDTSTIDPATSRTLHDAAAAREVSYLDAPVTSGEPGAAGTEGARTGTLTFLVGGEAADYARAEPVLRVLGTRLHHLGPAGAGSIMKLISNHIAGITTMAVAEGVVLAAAAGFPAEQMLEVCRSTVAQSYVMEDDVRSRVVGRDFEPGFTVDLYHKDLNLTAELGRALNVPLLYNQLTLEMFQMMRAQGRGQKSHVDCVNFLAELAGVDIYGRRST